MHFVASGEVGHVDLSPEAEGRDKFISVIVEYNVAHLMQCLLILTPLAVADVMEGGGKALDAVAACEVNADHHGHLHAVGEVVREVVLDGLPQPLHCYHPSFLIVLPESKDGVSLDEGLEVSACLANKGVIGVTEEAEDELLPVVVVAESLLVDFQGIKPIVLAWPGLTLVQQVLLPRLHLVELPLAATFPKTEEKRPHINVTACHSELHVFATPSLHLFAPQVHTAHLHVLHLNVLRHPQFTGVEDLPHCC